MDKHIKKQLAFTLIELLVVIAIIGILSALIVVGMSSTTQKATIAKAQVFSNSLRNALMSNMVSEWKFDQVDVPTSGKTPDSWGTNNGTLVDALGACDVSHCPQWVASCVYGGCFNFDDTGDYIDLASIISLSGEFTVGIWAYRDTNNTYDFIVGNSGNDCKIGFHSSNKKMFVRIIAGGTSDSSSSGEILINTWNYIVITRNSSNKVDYYLNGGNALRLFSDVAQVGNFEFNRLGNDSGNYYDGKIDEIRAFTAVIPTSQIQQNYFAGLSKIFAKQIIRTAEYQKRITGLTSNYAKK
ncbi:MAG: LamG-like jellyroll fold domain-containing protein [Candidatus Paceibacterota bacterium]